MVQDTDETDAEARLRENIDAYPSSIEAGDVVIDLVERRPLYVTERKGTAVDVFEREAFDLTTYKVHPWLPVTPYDDVFECVFIPTKPSDLPSKKKSQTYSYPRGRLARVAVEWLYDADGHRADDAAFGTIAALIDHMADGSDARAVVNAAQDAFGDDVGTAVSNFAKAEYGLTVDVDDADVPTPDEGDGDPKGSGGEDAFGDDADSIDFDDGKLGDFEDFEG